MVSQVLYVFFFESAVVGSKSVDKMKRSVSVMLFLIVSLMFVVSRTYESPTTEQSVGGQIDLYGGASNLGYGSGYPMLFPAPYGGQGPNHWMDLVFPQSNVSLYANVTNDDVPVPSVNVTFTIEGPYDWVNGTLVEKSSWRVWADIEAATNQDGVAETIYSMPWSDANPENFTGVWNVTASALVDGQTISDEMTFAYQPPVTMTNVSTDQYYYNYAQSVVVTVAYSSYSVQFYQALVKVDLRNSTGTTWGWAGFSRTIGGAYYYGNGQITPHTGTFTGHFVVPGQLGVGGFDYVHVNCYDKSPDIGGVPLCPEFAPPPQIVVGIGTYSNVTITDLVVGSYAMRFTASGPAGQVGFVEAWIPLEFNSTDIQVFIDGFSVQPPFPTITNDGIEYVIYFEFTLSTHDIIIQYATSAAAQTAGGGCGGQMPHMN